MFPWIPFLKKRGGKKLSDIEFLAIKEFDGKLRSNEGALAANGTLCTLTANTGKDMYIARAKVILRGASKTGTAELTVNGTVVETVDLATGSSSINTEYEFKNVGHKVAATEIIKIEITASSATPVYEGFIECFEEDTGESPQIPSI